MRTGFVIVALTIGLLAGGVTGASLAGDMEGAGAAGFNVADPEGSFGWNSQFRGPVETAALPEAMSAASNSAEFPFVEIGGKRHRVGLDTGP